MFYVVAGVDDLHQTVVSPLDVQEWVEIHLVLMFDVPIVFGVGEHMVHVVFW